MIRLLFGGLRDLWVDLLEALGRLLERGPRPDLLAPAAAGLAAAWLLYVPAHELMHAAGCVAAGGTVSEVRLSRWHGGALLERALPFVRQAAPGEYAGRLTGFDTGGSDLRFLATDLAPYLPTILIGAPLLRRLGRAPASPARAWLFGPAVVLAAAPLVSLTGDYYEMGSVLATRLPGLTGLKGLRSDDLLRLAGEIARGEVEAGGRGLLVVAISLFLSVVLASATCRLGAACDLIWRRRTRRTP